MVPFFIRTQYVDYYCTRILLSVSQKHATKHLSMFSLDNGRFSFFSLVNSAENLQ